MGFNIGLLQAYRITIRNKTGYKIRFTVHYHRGEWLKSMVCIPYSKSLKPHKKKVFRSGGCLVKKIIVEPFGKNVFSIKPVSYSPGIGKRMGGNFWIEAKSPLDSLENIKLEIKRK